MLYLITATNADGSYRQWAERIETGNAHKAAAIAEYADPYQWLLPTLNRGRMHACPSYTAKPL